MVESDANGDELRELEDLSDDEQLVLDPSRVASAAEVCRRPLSEAVERMRADGREVRQRIPTLT